MTDQKPYSLTQSSAGSWIVTNASGEKIGQALQTVGGGWKAQDLRELRIHDEIFNTPEEVADFILGHVPDRICLGCDWSTREIIWTARAVADDIQKGSK